MARRIYLDQNKWIELARAYHGRANSSAHAAVLAAALNSVETGRTIFPISSAHYMEVAKAKDAGRRQRLASFMVELSGGKSIAAAPGVMQSLVYEALCKLFEVSNAIGPTPIFGHGMNWAFGEQFLPAPERLRFPIGARILDQIANSPLILAGVLADPDASANRASILQLRQRELAMATHACDARDAITPYGRDARRTTYTAGMVKSVGREIEVGLKLIGRRLEDFFSSTEQVLRLVDLIPPLDVERTLVVERDFHLSRKPAANDMLDIAALSMAIAYCDVVVTERFWQHIANSTRIAERYSTVVLSNVNDLMPYLQG
jgi:hypothetical protein